ncbi:hypothetical protein D3C87_1476720 [compost metagenome]
MTTDRRPLNGSLIDGWIELNPFGVQQLHFSYVIINRGRGSSGPMFMRFYSSDIPFSDPNTDETDYKTSTFIDSKSFNPLVLPGGVSMPYISEVQVPSDFKLGKKPVTLAIRLYYADGKTSNAQISLRLKK